GFVQKIFYVHVPMAIVALCGFIAGGVFAIQHLRSGDSSWDLRSYVAIHLSIILGVGVLATGSIWARAGVLPRGLPPLLRLLPAALLDRGPGPAGALLVCVRDRGRRLRAAQLPRRAAGGGLHPPAGAVADGRRPARRH